MKKVEQEMASDPALTHEYLTILGLPAFSEASTAMLLGKDNPVVIEGRAFGVQCLSGTGALRVGGGKFDFSCVEHVCHLCSQSSPQSLYSQTS